MKTKLIKKEYGYVLGVEDKLGTRLIAVSSQKHQEILDKLDVVCEYKLSLKNCQAIERGYDLDELAKEANGYLYYDSKKENKALAFDDGYRVGFQKALELMGDKKFSEEDMQNCWKKAFDVGYNFGHELGDSIIANEDVDNYIQSLQQTEWDVEVEMEFEVDTSKLFGAIYGQKPKLDADGCLMLKRI